MKKYILVLLVAVAAWAPLYIFRNYQCPFKQVLAPPVTEGKKTALPATDLSRSEDNFLNYLRLRKDVLALAEIEKILSLQPDDLSALWGKAEVLRRNYKFTESERILNRILALSPCHAPALISLSYIRYHDGKLNDALRLLKAVLDNPDLDRKDRTLAYMLMGSINAKRAAQGGLFSKIAYGTHVGGYFEKARALAADLSEVHLGLGAFYLLAPKIVGGGLDKAIQELEIAVKLTPDFATANARLAQAYKKKGDLEKYDFYLKQARGLDPENEVLKEIE